MKPSTHDLIAYLEQNELKYAQRSDDEDIVMLASPLSAHRFR